MTCPLLRLMTFSSFVFRRCLNLWGLERWFSLPAVSRQSWLCDPWGQRYCWTRAIVSGTFKAVSSQLCEAWGPESHLHWLCCQTVIPHVSHADCLPCQHEHMRVSRRMQEERVVALPFCLSISVSNFIKLPRAVCYGNAPTCAREFLPMCLVT